MLCLQKIDQWQMTRIGNGLRFSLNIATVLMVESGTSQSAMVCPTVPSADFELDAAAAARRRLQPWRRTRWLSRAKKVLTATWTMISFRCSGLFFLAKLYSPSIAEASGRILLCRLLRRASDLCLDGPGRSGGRGLSLL